MTVLTRSRKKKYSVGDLIKLGVTEYKTHLEIMRDINKVLPNSQIDIFKVSRSISEKNGEFRNKNIDKEYVVEKRSLLMKKMGDIYPRHMEYYIVELTEKEQFHLQLIGVMLLDLTRCGRCDEELWQEVMGE